MMALMTQYRQHEYVFNISHHLIDGVYTLLVEEVRLFSG